MNPAEIIVLLLLAVGVVAAIRRNLRKGIPCESRGVCCGNCAGCKAHGGCPVRTLAEKAGDGLHCANCVAHAKRALDAIPGVVADVTLEPPRAVVRMDRDVPDETLRTAVEAEGYRVVSITRR